MKFRTNAQSQNVTPITPPVENKEYLHTSTAGAGLPFAQAIITGVLMFVGTWLLGWLIFDLTDPIKPAVILSVVTVIAVWLWRLLQWANLTNIENLTGLDLNRDGVVGTKEPEVIRIKMSQLNDGRNGASYQSSEMDLPVTRVQLETLARGMLGGMPFSERVWAGPGKPFSSNEYRMLRSVMIRRELLELANEKDPRQGYALTEKGWSVMGYFEPAEEEEPEEEIQDEDIRRMP